jgi:hypothetical protein
LPITDITATSAILNAEVCTVPVTEWGFRVSSDLGATYEYHYTSGLLATTTFSHELSGLEADSLYYYVAVIYSGNATYFSLPVQVFMTSQQGYTEEGIGNNTGFVPVLPNQPGGWIRPEKDWGSIGGVPWTFITYILVTAVMVFAGLVLSKYIRKLAVMVIVLGFILGVLCFWPKGGYLDWWILFPYVLVAWALLHRQGESPIEE